MFRSFLAFCTIMVLCSVSSADFGIESWLGHGEKQELQLGDVIFSKREANGYVKRANGTASEKGRNTTISVTLKLKGDKAKKIKFICKATVKVNGTRVKAALHKIEGGSIIGYENATSVEGTYLDLNTWKLVSHTKKRIAMKAWYNPGENEAQYDCFGFVFEYDGKKAQKKKCWN